jgi:2-polyprenyl-3-methyl-5-hydroxy-6-metoxy-1,4-benzoquinol methylase
MSVGYGSDAAAVEEARNYRVNSSFRKEADPTSQRLHIINYYNDLFIRAQSVIGKSITSVFEVGGLTGMFLEVAKSHHASCAGCELNVEGARIQRELGFDTETGNFFHYEPRGRRYDLVVALDYLEHSWHPKADLMKLRSMVAPGGGLMLKTFVEELDDGSMLAPPTHAYHFFGHNLYRILTDSGFIVRLWDIHFKNQPLVVCSTG